MFFYHPQYLQFPWMLSLQLESSKKWHPKKYIKEPSATYVVHSLSSVHVTFLIQIELNFLFHSFGNIFYDIFIFLPLALAYAYTFAFLFLLSISLFQGPNRVVFRLELWLRSCPIETVDKLRSRMLDALADTDSSKSNSRAKSLEFEYKKRTIK